MFKSAFSLLALFVAVTGCTHANVSSIPQLVNGTAVFTYRGRANFGHQLKAADQAMISTCKEYNGGNPSIVDQRTEDLGYVVTGNTTTGINAMGNQNQIIQFSCVK
ncbi:hypothetical protein N9R01_00555 [Porticoccaceae bacterium]|jgi:hypothetical protein|nr:hypothetical protein [Porticoccaceae bacterium]